MRRLLYFIAFIALAVSPLYAQSSSFSHAIYDRVLSQYVDTRGLVDYGALKANPTDLNTYLAQLAQFSPETTPERFPTKNDSLAYWINAYNAFVIAGVVEAYPVKSVQDIKWFYGFFKQERFVVGGQSLSLDYIENEIIRKKFGDPRIHAAINCAAISCPPIQRYVFRPDDLEQQLQAVMQAMIRDKRHVFVNRTNQTVFLSSIFDWFSVDFQRGGQGKEAVLAYVSAFLTADDQAFLQQHPNVEIQFLKYDWALNDQKQ